MEEVNLQADFPDNVIFEFLLTDLAGQSLTLFRHCRRAFQPSQNQPYDILLTMSYPLSKLDWRDAVAAMIGARAMRLHDACHTSMGFDPELGFPFHPSYIPLFASPFTALPFRATVTFILNT